VGDREILIGGDLFEGFVRSQVTNKLNGTEKKRNGKKETISGFVNQKKKGKQTEQR